MLRLWGHADPESNPASLCPGYVTSRKTLPVSEPHIPLPRLEEDQLGQQGEGSAWLRINDQQTIA